MNIGYIFSLGILAGVELFAIRSSISNARKNKPVNAEEKNWSWIATEGGILYREDNCIGFENSKSIEVFCEH